MFYHCYISFLVEFVPKSNIWPHRSEFRDDHAIRRSAHRASWNFPRVDGNRGGFPLEIHTTMSRSGPSVRHRLVLVVRSWEIKLFTFYLSLSPDFPPFAGQAHVLSH